MVDSVSGGRPQTPVEAFQEQQKTNQADKIDKIGLSYNSDNSVSHRDARGETPLAAPETHAPTIPEPNAGTTATGVELSTVKSQSQLDQLRAGVYSSFDMIEKKPSRSCNTRISSKSRHPEVCYRSGEAFIHFRCTTEKFAAERENSGGRCCLSDPGCGQAGSDHVRNSDQNG